MAVLNLSGFRTMPLIRPAETAECGLACDGMVAGAHGRKIDLPSQRSHFSISVKSKVGKLRFQSLQPIGASLRRSLPQAPMLQRRGLLQRKTALFDMRAAVLQPVRVKKRVESDGTTHRYGE